ncbi:MAG TPA: NAD(+) diphosphatase [Deltaproteobacteria bacterium]|nr:NAD(+) diphosphatase [Deltaproteobacteria bacterium]
MSSRRSHSFPLPFVPSHKPPPEPGERPILFAFRRRELLVSSELALPSVEEIDAIGLEALRTQYLGQLDGRHCYSAELPEDVEVSAGFRFADLRTLFGSLDETMHALAGRAVQIVEWDRTHQFCGACAEPTVLSETDRSRSCPKCRIPMYPRLAPAMIVAVEKGDQILLARSPHFPAGIMSVLAGFVEPGESAEEAVIREVFEETGICVRNIRYFSSQAWPFPNSLMLGFQAEYDSGEIEVDGVEIEEAGWYPADDMPAFFPGRVSIAQWLIRDFLVRNGHPPPD